MGGGEQEGRGGWCVAVNKKACVRCGRRRRCAAANLLAAYRDAAKDDKARLHQRDNKERLVESQTLREPEEPEHSHYGN